MPRRSGISCGSSAFGAACRKATSPRKPTSAKRRSVRWSAAFERLRTAARSRCSRKRSISTRGSATAFEAARRPHAVSRPPTSHTTSRPSALSFVGREADVDRVLKLLRRSRLVTVTGSGGVGKTRVALEAARHLLGDPFPEVWFVDLGPVIDGDFIAAKIANSVRPPIGDRADTVSELASALAKRHMLLILDNCEHVVTQAADAADMLLESCSRISILATSRERLNVAGEFVYRLPSLLLEPAIELFSQRARMADPRLSLDAKSLPAVTDIARRLGGIPLALELTAAQLPQLGLEALRAQLHERLSVASGRPDLPARQQTVMATIEWSYDLLTPKERAVLCETAVFTGGFTLAGAEAVSGGEGPDRSHVLPLLSSLTNKSLLNVLSDGDRERYGLLDSVRSFGLERLRGAGTYDSACRRHAQWFAAIADEVQTTVLMLMRERCVELVPEFDDIRAAVVWSLNSSDRDDLALAGRILCGLFGLWDFMGRRREHRNWLEMALERIDEEQHPRVSAYLLRAFITRAQAEVVALEAIDRAILLGEKSGDRLEGDELGLRAGNESSEQIGRNKRMALLVDAFERGFDPCRCSRRRPIESHRPKRPQRMRPARARSSRSEEFRHHATAARMSSKSGTSSTDRSGRSIETVFLHVVRDCGKPPRVAAGYRV